MKFSVDGRQFQAALDKAMTVASPRALLPLSEYIRISAGDGRIAVSGGSYDSFVRAYAQGSIEAPGDVCVHRDDLRRARIPEGRLQISCIGTRLCLRSETRRSEIPFRNPMEEKVPLDTSEKCDLLFQIDSDALLRVLRATDPARGKSESNGRPIMMGFHLSGKLRKVIACDGYRMHSAGLQAGFEAAFDETYSRTIVGDAYAHLKKLAPRKPETFGVYDLGHGLKISGDGFDYYARCLEGDYPNAFGLVPDSPEYSFTLSTKELRTIAAEYCSLANKKDSSAMVIACDQERMVTTLVTSEYRTLDHIASFHCSRLPARYFLATSPHYLKDALTPFDDAEISVGGLYQPMNTRNPGFNIGALMLSRGDLLMLVQPILLNETVLLDMTNLITEEMGWEIASDDKPQPENP